MLNQFTVRHFVRTIAVVGLMAPQGMQAGCNCGGGVVGGAPLVIAEPTLVGEPEMMGSPPVWSSPVGPGMMGAPAPGPSPVTVTDGSPPPGTLGQTYQRAMRPIPVEKHPRISIVDVRVTGATDVKVYGTNEYRTKDGVAGFRDRRDANLWHFESEPLMPGVPHIYRVEAKFGKGRDAPTQERFFRFVPGRIVTLDF